MGILKNTTFLSFFVCILVQVLSRTVGTSGYCTSKECILAAGDILSVANLSADPCVDFYEFACGNWKKEHPLSFDDLAYSPFEFVQNKVNEILRDELSKNTESTSRAVQDAKVFFSTCMTSDSQIEALQEDLSILRRWPIVAGDTWDPQTFDFNDMFTTIKYLSTAILFAIDVQVDFMNSTTYSLYIDQIINLGVPPILLLLPGNFSQAITAYKDYISGAARVLGATDSLSVERDVEDIIRFETQIASFIEPREENLNFTKLYNKMNISSLQENTGTFFEWNSLLVHLLNNTDIGDDFEVVVTAAKFLKSLDTLLKETDNRTIANYMLWRYVQFYSSIVRGELEDLKFNLQRALLGVKDKTPRWETCVSVVNNLMAYAASKLYVEKNFDENTKDKASEMVTFIRQVFTDQLSREQWLTNNGTLEKALEKAENISELIGYPDWIFNDTAIDELYENYYIGNVSYYENVKQSVYAITEEQFSMLNTEAPKKLWIVAPTVVNAVYSPILNSINFPAAILQPPFFEAERPMYLNFGAIGMIIGHEITHGFDITGRQFDANGNLNNWWDYSTEKQYNELTQCFVEEYNNFCPEELKSHSTCVNGKNTLSENIADSVGLKTAFNAYHLCTSHHKPDDQLPGLQTFSNDQLFFLSFAQMWCDVETDEAYEINAVYNEHSLNKYRTNGALSNTFEFVNAYQCMGKPMDRPMKCVLF